MLKTETRAREMIDALGKYSELIVVTAGVRLRTFPVQAQVKDGKIVCTVDDFETLENIRHSPRVAFACNQNETTKSIWGNGIARNQNGDLVIEPYRLEQKDPKEERLELVRGVWTDTPTILPHPLTFRQKAAFWLKASRAVSFPLAAIPVLAGGVFMLDADYFNPLTYLLSVVGGVAALAGANLISDYQDYKNGVDTLNALSSHTGALVREEVEPSKILIAGFMTLSLVALCGVLLVGLTGWPVLLFGAVGLLGCLFYTMGPFAYKYVGLGELGIFLFMGPLMFLGAFIVQHNTLTYQALLLSIPLGMLTASVSLANNLRDIIDDSRAGLRTLPIRIGVAKTKYLYYALTILPFLLCAWVAWRESAWSLCLVLLALPQAIVAIRTVSGSGKTALEIRAAAPQKRYPLNSIRLHFRFGLLLIAGEILIAYMR